MVIHSCLGNKRKGGLDVILRLAKSGEESISCCSVIIWILHSAALHSG
jgi:hypothetical protein